MKKNVTLAFSLILYLISLKTFCCTGLFLENLSHGYVYARTLEFGQDLHSKILCIPRAYPYTSPTPSSDKGGLAWKTKYAVIGANAFDFPFIVDGVNEKGLAGGLFYFPEFAQYQDVTPKNYAQSLPMWELLTWLLTNFSTIQEIKTELPKIYVSKAAVPGIKEVPPAHLIVHDSSGKSLVIEYVKGKLHLHDNPLGVITNSPNFDWHLTNIRNYINLSPINAKETTMAGITFSQLGQGSGMLGLPGDFTPPSRFVRITSFTQAAPKMKTELDGINQAFHILNNFDIPKGSVADRNGVLEDTQWTSAIDMKNKTFYIKTYENFQLQKIDLMAQDLNAKKLKAFELKTHNKFLDIAQQSQKL
jgi:choloylglycine hydrolase